jgi:hypothetical protein
VLKVFLELDQVGIDHRGAEGLFSRKVIVDAGLLDADEV